MRIYDKSQIATVRQHGDIKLVSAALKKRGIEMTPQNISMWLAGVNKSSRYEFEIKREFSFLISPRIEALQNTVIHEQQQQHATPTPSTV